MAGTTHVIGAGLAGLSAAIRLSERGKSVVVHEAAGHPLKEFPTENLC